MKCKFFATPPTEECNGRYREQAGKDKSSMGGKIYKDPSVNKIDSEWAAWADDSFLCPS